MRTRLDESKLSVLVMSLTGVWGAGVDVALVGRPVGFTEMTRPPVKYSSLGFTRCGSVCVVYALVNILLFKILGIDERGWQQYLR